MPERIPDPTLMARLQLSVKGIDWAASLVAPYQHRQPDGEWSAHQHLAHLLAVERENYQPRIRRMAAESNPSLQSWESAGYMSERYRPDGDIESLAGELMREREATVGLLKALTKEDWCRTATWPDGKQVDLAWVAEKVLWHALDHFASLLDLHGEFESLQAPRWASGPG